jgi:hypothetical protein
MVCVARAGVADSVKPGLPTHFTDYRPHVPETAAPALAPAAAATESPSMSLASLSRCMQTLFKAIPSFKPNLLPRPHKRNMRTTNSCLRPMIRSDPRAANLKLAHPAA